MAGQLLDGESPVLTVHRHWMLLAASLWIPALAVAAVVILDLVLAFPSEAKLALTLAVLALAGFWLIVAWLRWIAASLTLTDRRVILRWGVLSRSSKVIPLDRVQDVSTSQSLAGRILGYGNVEIDAAGVAGAELLDHVPAPDRLRDEIFVQSEHLRRRIAGDSSQPEF